MPVLCPGPAPFSLRTGWQSCHQDLLQVPLASTLSHQKEEVLVSDTKGLPFSKNEFWPLLLFQDTAAPIQPASTLAKGRASCFSLRQAHTMKRSSGARTAATENTASQVFMQHSNGPGAGPSTSAPTSHCPGPNTNSRTGLQGQTRLVQSP